MELDTRQETTEAATSSIPTPPTIADPKVVKRNFFYGVTNGVLYITAETILDPTLVLVSFLSQLTQSPILLGLVLPIRDGAWSLPQLWVSGFLQNQRHKLTFYRQGSYVRIASWVLLALTMNLVQEPKKLLVAFFAVYILSSLANGLGGLPFLEIVSKTIPAVRRGEFFAWRLGLGGLLGVAGSFLVRWVLDPKSGIAFPYNYGLLASLFCVLATLSMIVFYKVEEPLDPVVVQRSSFGEQFKRALVVLREDVDYRRYLAMQSSFLMAGSAAPFFAVFLQHELGGSPAMIGVYLAVVTATNLLANAGFGRISGKVGYRKVLILAATAGTLMSTLVLLLSVLARPLGISPLTASLWLLPVFFLSAVRGTGNGVSSSSLLLGITPEKDRSLYIGFTNTILGGVLLLTGASGLLVNVLGYPALFGFTILMHLSALFFVLKIRQKGL